MATGPLAYNRFETLGYTANDDPTAATKINTVTIPGSNEYTAFNFQFTGFQAGTKFDVFAALANDGVFSRLDSTSCGLAATDHATAGADGVVLNVQLWVPCKGGLRVKQKAVSNADGKVHVAMSGNAYRSGREW